MMGGLAGTLFLATYLCGYRSATVGTFSIMVAYWGQLSGRLTSVTLKTGLICKFL